MPSKAPAQAEQAPSWIMEPSIWNLSLNRSQTFYATVISLKDPLPENPPKVRFFAKDRHIEVKIEKYDYRTHRSFLISIPRLLSLEKAEEATRQGIKFRREASVFIADEGENELWSSQFAYEVGDF